MLLTVAMLLSLCACGSSSSGKKDIDDITDEEWEAAAEELAGMDDEEPAAEEETGEKIYQLGETISCPTGIVEVTFDSFCFSDYVNNDKEPTDEANAFYIASEGKTFFCYTGTMTLVENPKEKIQCWLYSEDLVYNNEYKFSDTHDIRCIAPGESINNITFEPFTNSTTRVINAAIEVPEVIETDTESSLILNHSIRDRVNGAMSVENFIIQFR